MKGNHARARVLTLAAGLLLTGAVVAHAQSMRQGLGKAEEAARGTVAGSTRDFLTGAIQNQLAESSLSKVAAQKATTPAVKAFADQSQSQSQGMLGQLRSLADKKGVQAPTQPSGQDETAIQQLSGESGPAFERGYIREMIKRKAADVASLRRQSTASDSEVKSLAQKALPVEQGLLGKAQQLDKQLGGGG